MKKIFLKNTRISGFARKTTLGIVLTAMGMTFHACNNDEEDKNPVLTPSVNNISAKWVMPTNSKWVSFEFFYDNTYKATMRSGGTQSAAPHSAQPLAADESEAKVLTGKYTMSGTEVTLDGIGTVKVEEMTADNAKFSITYTAEAKEKYHLEDEQVNVSKTALEPIPQDNILGKWEYSEIDTICVDTNIMRTTTQQVSLDTTMSRIEQRDSIAPAIFIYGDNFCAGSICSNFNLNVPILVGIVDNVFVANGGQCIFYDGGGYGGVSLICYTGPEFGWGPDSLHALVFDTTIFYNQTVWFDTSVWVSQTTTTPVDTQICRQVVGRSKTLEFTQGAAFLTIRDSIVSEHSGYYVYPYRNGLPEFENNNVSAKFYDEGWHYMGYTTENGSAMLLRRYDGNNQPSGEVQRFVKRR
jgi:hypothetical protein